MFVEQVDVGDFLRFKSCVLYTEIDNPDQPLIYVEVVAHVTRPEMRSSVVSPSKRCFQTTKKLICTNLGRCYDSYITLEIVIVEGL